MIKELDFVTWKCGYEKQGCPDYDEEERLKNVTADFILRHKETLLADIKDALEGRNKYAGTIDEALQIIDKARGK